MKLSFVSFLFILFHSSGFAQNKPSQWVKLEIGTVTGNTFYGSALPFSMCKVGPNTEPVYPTNGYNPTKRIEGFSHNHLSGTGGGGRYGNVMVIPHVGQLQLDTCFSVKNDEHASVGYYYVHLGRKAGDVKVELTSTEHSAIHRYTFFTWDKATSFQANVLFDLTKTITRYYNDPKGAKETKNARCLGANVRFVGSNEVEGEATFSGGWGGDFPYTVYFYAQVNKAPTNKTLHKHGYLDAAGIENPTKANFEFTLSQKEQVLVKVGISEKSVEKAKDNVLKEIPHWDFEKVRVENAKKWDSFLDRLEVMGDNPEDLMKFYTALYHSFLLPTDKSDNVNYRAEGSTYYDEHYCIWDVFRSTMPLYSMFYPEVQRKIINSLLTTYQQKGWLPDGWTVGNYASVQGGSNADVVMADAIVKGLGGFDEKLALEAITKNAETVSENPLLYGRFLAEYKKLGYLTSETHNGASSRSLEYCYNDYCIAQAYKSKGLNKEADYYLKRSLSYRKLFHPMGFMWAKDRKGKWMPSPSATWEPKKSWDSPYFYEGNSLDYTPFVPHDQKGLIDLFGGEEEYVKFLDEIFDNGHFSMGNEPSFFTPYLYNFASRYDKTALRISQIRSTLWNVGRRGIPGQDDAGAMSAWFVWSSLGIYPLPGQNFYLVGTPLFEESSWKLEKGTLKMKAEGLTKTAIYVQEILVQSKGKTQSLFRSYLTHQELLELAEVNGTITFVMGEKPSERFGKEQLPGAYEYNSYIKVTKKVKE